MYFTNTPLNNNRKVEAYVNDTWKCQTTDKFKHFEYSLKHDTWSLTESWLHVLSCDLITLLARTDSITDICQPTHKDGREIRHTEDTMSLLHWLQFNSCVPGLLTPLVDIWKQYPQRSLNIIIIKIKKSFWIPEASV